jgi:hypothetical protein
VITGSSDRYAPPREGAEADLNDPRAGSLQEVRLAALLAGYDDTTKSHVNTTGGLFVASVSIDRYGSADIALSGSIRLQIFPDGSAEEDWHFFETAEGGAHFVIDGGRMVR